MYRIIFVLFTILIIFYWFTIRSDKITPLWRSIPRQILTDYQSCESDENCGTESLVCFNKKCIPKLRGSGECNSQTGNWTLVQKEDRAYVTCVCKFPHLITQQYEGGNCDMDIACGIHGHLEADLKTCRCDYGYAPAYTEIFGPSCRKMTPYEQNRQMSGPYREDETDASSGIFGDNYIGTNRLKRPCSFDALSGRPLKFTRFEPDVGCLCDPRYGNFGVTIDHPDYLKNIPGYNACASLLRREPDHPLSNVKLYVYFYMFDKTPAAFIQFSDLDPNVLAPEFKSNSTWQIEEIWPYDYMQYVLRNEKFSARTRSCNYWSGLFNIFYCNEHEYVKTYKLIPCKHIPQLIQEYAYFHQHTYNMLYVKPACVFDENDTEVHPIYRGRVVMNPFHMNWEHNPILWRTNGLEMTLKSDGTWHLDLAPSFRIDEFLGGSDTIEVIPKLKHRISQNNVKK